MAANFIGWVSYMYWPIGVTAEEEQDAGDQADDGGHLEGAFEEIQVLFADEVIGADAEDQESWPSQSRSEMVCQKNIQPLGLPISAKKLTNSARPVASLIT